MGEGAYVPNGLCAALTHAQYSSDERPGSCFSSERTQQSACLSSASSSFTTFSLPFCAAAGGWNALLNPLIAGMPVPRVRVASR